jgi:hypothetical protein
MMRIVKFRTQQFILEKNTFNSKNGERILNEVEDFKALQEEYGLIVEFYIGGKNRGIESLTKQPENGKINFTVDEVYKILKEEKKRIKNEKKQH